MRRGFTKNRFQATGFQLPRFRGCDRLVDSLDVFDAFGGEEILQRLQAFCGVNGHAVFPCGASAKDAGIVRAAFRGHAQRFNKLRVADARAQIDERLFGDRSRAAKVIQRFGARVSRLSFERAAAFHIVGVDRDFHLEHVHLVLRLGKLRHALGHDLRFLLRVFETLLVAAFRIVSDEFQKERNVVRFGLRADALDEGVFDVVHFRIVEGSVVDQNFDRVGAHILLETLHGNVRQQIRQAPRLRVVVPAVFVRQQQAGVLRACFRRRKPPFGIEQNRAGVRRQNPRDRGLELLHHLVRDVFLRDALRGSERLRQAAALVHGSCRDDAIFIRQRIHVLHFASGKTHEKCSLLFEIKIIPRDVLSTGDGDDSRQLHPAESVL